MIVYVRIEGRMFAPQTFNPLQMISLFSHQLHSINNQLALLVVQLIAREVQVLDIVIFSQTMAEVFDAKSDGEVASRYLQGLYGRAFGNCLS